MLYSLMFRLGKPSYCVQMLSRVTSTCSLSALHLHNTDLISLNKSPRSQWACEHQHVLLQMRNVHTAAESRNKAQSQHREKEMSVSSTKPPPGLSAAQKVKQAGRDFTYLIVVLVGLGVTGGLMYVIFQELFSSSSPSKIYSKAFSKCKSHPEVIGAFGEPVKGYGETTRRGRRQQVSHIEYMKDGQKHMRLKFYIEGSEPGLRGIVHSESRENQESGKYEFRYIFVEVDTYPRRTIVIEDNR
ncbi:mitochondrial import inner membrane translocase subunit Tim21-like [Tachysurus fulvidraco]|uniref:mitochondrial import inner membrane translocase subunit Tim21-like n=1 Tax=Tachysurus fulvidraco TaxID=1234273 RepID=UPI000F4E3448|nr:mitochondrial import inner membrane translocase subunit Tim21-like [Tachysurus fulvidraco]